MLLFGTFSISKKPLKVVFMFALNATLFFPLQIYDSGTKCVGFQM